MRAWHPEGGISSATPLPRWDGRPAAILESARPALCRRPSTLGLRYWQALIPFRHSSLAAFHLVLERTREVVVAFCYQPEGSSMLGLREVDPSLPLICASQISRIDRGGAEQLEALIGEHHVSVVVVDNLSRLMPQVPWSSSTSRFDEAAQETLRELRRLISGFDWPIDVVLFHLVGQAKAEKLLADGLVDAIEEVRL